MTWTNEQRRRAEQQHGTVAAYLRHIYQGEPQPNCTSCTAAWIVFAATWRPPSAVREANRADYFQRQAQRTTP
jgi:hypothetical protein